MRKNAAKRKRTAKFVFIAEDYSAHSGVSNLLKTQDRSKSRTLARIWDKNQKKALSLNYCHYYERGGVSVVTGTLWNVKVEQDGCEKTLRD